MSNIGVHDFAIPHEYVQPTRDMVIIQLPAVPKKVGGVHIPDMFRDMAKHNVAAGRIVALGPLAFTYKDGEGSVSRQDVKIGDWVTIRPYAGTMVMGGKLQINSAGYRYVSSFQDVIGIVPADKMPDPDTLIWSDDEADMAAARPPEDFGGSPRERISVKD